MGHPTRVARLTLNADKVISYCWKETGEILEPSTAKTKVQISDFGWQSYTGSCGSSKMKVDTTHSFSTALQTTVAFLG